MRRPRRTSPPKCEAPDTVATTLRLLHVHCRYREVGGEDAVVDAERDALRGAGVHVVPYDAVNPSSALRASGRLALAPWNPASFLDVRRIVDREAVDVAHVHNTWFAASPSIVEALYRAGIPVVMTLHNFRLSCVNGLLFRDGRTCTDCVGRSPWRGVVHRCYRSSALASAAVATTISANRALGTWSRGVTRFLVLNDIAEQVLAATGVPGERVSRTANFVADPGSRQQSPSSSRTIVYVGRLSHEKGIELLLRAWRSWRPSEDWTLLVAGDGPMRRSLGQVADHRVRFVGRLDRSEVTDLLLRARALVLPSLVFENQPMAPLEAFSAGLPVLGRGVGGTLDVVRPLGDDWLVNDATPAAWTGALDVLRDDSAVDAAGAAARQLYDVTYAPEVAVQRLQQMYDDLRIRSKARVT
jgi:glycosyltransferase involved in cell wall biosynthesis